MFHKREIGVRNDTYTRAEIDAKDGAIQAAADKAQETADGAVDVNNTQNTQISSLQKSAHAHSNKDVLDKTEQPYTTAERDKLAGLENYVHPSHTAHSKDMYKIAVDDEGHVTEAETMTKSDITALGIPGEDTNTTYELSKSGNTIKMAGSDGSSSEIEVESDLNTTYTLTKNDNKITLNGSDNTTYTVFDSDHTYYLMQYYNRYGTGLNAPKVLLKGTSGDDTAITVPYARTSASGWNPLYTECYGNLQNTDKYASLGDILFAYPDDDNGESLNIHANLHMKYGTAAYYVNVFIHTNYGNQSCVEIFVPPELSPPNIQWTVLFTSPIVSEGFEKQSRVFRICIDQESMKKIEYVNGTVWIDYLTGYRGGTLEPVQKSNSVDEYLKSFHNDYPIPTNVILSSENASDVAFTGDYNDLSNKPTIPDISGKQDKLTAGTNITISGNTISAKDTTYTSKSAVSGGTDVSLVTTGEKAIWNAKTSNVGTITGIKMNGASKGTSGVVDLGTVITAHQDISGKQDKSTAVTHTVNAAVGSATKPVYIAANGVATSITHSIGSDVPANAKFTDTTYNDATQSAHGLMSAADKKKLDGMDLSEYLHYNAKGSMTAGTWYKFASYTCGTYYNYSTAIFAVGISYNAIRLFRVTLGNVAGVPSASRFSISIITGDVSGKIGYIISGNTVNLFLKPDTNIYGYIGRLAATAETGDFIQQTDLVAATSTETTAIVPIGNIVTDISASNTAAKLSTARKINTVEYDGTKDIMIPRSGIVCHEAGGTGGQQGYVKIATIKITAQYANMPTIIYYRNRGAFPVKLVIMFSNSDTTDPGLYVLEQTVELVNYNWKRAYMNKTAAGTWDLIIAKSEAWDSVQILDCQPASHISVTFTNVHISTLPSTAITSTVYERAMVTSTVAAAKTLTDSGWVDCPLAVTGNTTYPASTSSVKVRKYGKLVRLEAFVKYTIAFGTGHNVAIIPEGYRPNQLQREHGVTASASKDIIFNATLLPSGSLSFSPAGGGSASTFNPATSYECRMTYFID